MPSVNLQRVNLRNQTLCWRCTRAAVFQVENLCTCSSRSCGSEHLWLCRERIYMEREITTPTHLHLLYNVFLYVEISWKRIVVSGRDTHFPAQETTDQHLERAAFCLYTCMQRNAIYCAFYMRRARAIIHYAITCAARFNFITVLTFILTRPHNEKLSATLHRVCRKWWSVWKRGYRTFIHKCPRKRSERTELIDWIVPLGWISV